MEKEIWKDIPGYEGYYQVSNLDRVKSLDRYVNHNKGGLKVFKGSILKSSYKRKIYCLCKNGNKQALFIHQIKYITFIDSTYKPNGNKKVIDHIDNNPENNDILNLQVITNRQNRVKDIDKNKTTSKYIGVDKRDNRFRARIRIDGKTVNLGTYDTELEASNAYQQKLKELI